MPGYMLLTGWVVEFTDRLTPQQIQEAFDVSGTVPKIDFEVAKLHKPLRDIFERQKSVAEWMAEHGKLLPPTTVGVGLAWHCFEGKDSFMQAIYDIHSPNIDYKVWRLGFVDEIITELSGHELTKDIFEDTEKATIRGGMNLTDCFFEFYAVAHILNYHIHLILVDKEDKVINRIEFGKDFGAIRAIYARPTPLKIMIPDMYDPDELQATDDPVTTDGESDADDHDDDNSSDLSDLVGEETFEELEGELVDASGNVETITIERLVPEEPTYTNEEYLDEA